MNGKPPDYGYRKLTYIEEQDIFLPKPTSIPKKYITILRSQGYDESVQDSSRERTSAIRFFNIDSSITPLAMRECARETSWLSGKGSLAYRFSVSRSSSSRRMRVGRTVAFLSSASHIPSRLDFHGGTGLATPYFSAILPHT
jgi:hypothetical protein